MLSLRESGIKLAFSCPLWEGRAQYFTKHSIKIAKSNDKRRQKGKQGLVRESLFSRNRCNPERERERERGSERRENMGMAREK